MNKKLKNYENLGLIISFIKNEYPKKISKNFSSKVMSNIHPALDKTFGFSYFNSLVKIASVFIFAVVTVYVLQFNDNQIDYSGTAINNEYTHPTKTVINKNDDCKDSVDSSVDEINKKCN
tara:strand:- start:242 stop:601 length:360 start_codon:yes stop_codon:yes gene_type:complete